MGRPRSTASGPGPRFRSGSVSHVRLESSQRCARFHEYAAPPIPRPGGSPERGAAGLHSSGFGPRAPVPVPIRANSPRPRYAIACVRRASSTGRATARSGRPQGHSRLGTQAPRVRSRANPRVIAGAQWIQGFSVTRARVRERAKWSVVHLRTEGHLGPAGGRGGALAARWPGTGTRAGDTDWRRCRLPNGLVGRPPGAAGAHRCRSVPYACVESVLNSQENWRGRFGAPAGIRNGHSHTEPNCSR